MLTDGMSDSKGGINSEGKELLKNGGKKDGVAVVEERVDATFIAPPSKVIGLSDGLGVDFPIESGAFGFLLRMASKGLCLEAS